MPTDFTIIAIISGRGSNLKSLIDSSQKYRISAIFSNRDAAGLSYGRATGIPCYTFLREDFASVAEQKAALFAKLSALTPSLVCLAGYMQIVPEDFTRRFFGRVVNIHPSLLPKYPGLDTHRRALEAGDAEHGCSVHFVDAGVDTGPLIAQAKLAVNPSESEDELAARVLELEHRLYPWVVNSIAGGEIALEGTAVHYSPKAKAAAASSGFLLPSGEGL